MTFFNFGTMMIKWIRRIHKLLGLLLSVLFLMWFLSGVVMIYHSFPRVDSRLLTARQEALPGGTGALDSLLQVLPDSARLSGLSLEMAGDRPVFHLRGRYVPAALYADTWEEPAKPGFPELRRLAEQVYGAAAYRVDTLRSLDQWIPFGRLKAELPVYKFIFDDAERHELYIGSQSGKVLQMTDRRGRFWAWLGAIPHWVYFTSLRQHQELWTDVVVWASGLGCVLCISGLWLGVWAYWRNRRNGFRSPYRKRWYRWHHVWGMVFGVFALTFVFSGMMSMVDMPAWMQRGTKTVSRPQFRGREGGMLPAGTYRLDYRRLPEEIGGVKSIAWSSFGGHPYYTVITDRRKHYIDAADSATVRPFVLTGEMIREAVGRIHGPEVRYSLEQITEFDRNYYSPRGMLTLPVYKVTVDDEVHTCHYFNPETLYHSQFDDNRRLRSVLYGGLHSLNFKWLKDRPVVWNVVMYLLLAGGTFLSLTGVALTLGWLGRQWHRLFGRR